MTEVCNCGIFVHGAYRRVFIEVTRLNVCHRSCIHKIPFIQLSESSSPSPVTALAQSPAIDVVGIGFASGEVSIYDIRADEKLMRIIMREGPVRALAFRGGTRSSAPMGVEILTIYLFCQMDLLLLLPPQKKVISHSGI